VELVDAVKAVFMALPIFALLGGLTGWGAFAANARETASLALYALMAAVAAGAVMTPALLPWLPGRSFSVKGLVPAALSAFSFAAIRPHVVAESSGCVELLGWILVIFATTTYLSMNFTGASTYTSLSGVRKEMRVAVPAQIAGATVGLVLLFGSRLTT
jgi:hypothetical protein